jgi:hypothetical protein
MFALIPGQPVWVFGLEVLGAGALTAGAAALFLIRTLPNYRGQPASWLWSQVVLSQGQTLPLAVGGVLMTLGDAAGLYWMVPAVIFVVFAGVLNAWVLLVEILR